MCYGRGQCHDHVDIIQSVCTLNEREHGFRVHGVLFSEIDTHSVVLAITEPIHIAMKEMVRRHPRVRRQVTGGRREGQEIMRLARSLRETHTENARLHISPMHEQLTVSLRG